MKADTCPVCEGKSENEPSGNQISYRGARVVIDRVGESQNRLPSRVLRQRSRFGARKRLSIQALEHPPGAAARRGR